MTAANCNTDACKEVSLTRVFEAPRSLVYKMWTEPEHVAQWWGPHGFTNPLCELDVQPGGAIRIDMLGANNVLYPMAGTYRELVEPERIVFTSVALDEQGKPMLEVLNTITLIEQSGKTTLSLHARVVRLTSEAVHHASGMEIGWSQSLERLTSYVEKV